MGYIHKCKGCAKRLVRTPNSICRPCRSAGVNAEDVLNITQKELYYKGKIKQVDEHLFFLQNTKTRAKYRLEKVIDYWLEKRNEYKLKLIECK